MITEIVLQQQKPVANESFELTPSSQLGSKESVTTKRMTNHLRPMLASLVISIGSVAIGMQLGYPSTAIPDMKSQHKAAIRMSKEQVSWFASAPFLSGIPVFLVICYALDAWGRKLSMMLTILPIVVGWVMISSGASMPMMFIGRMITGVGLGMTASTVTVYIAEISPAEIRGQLTSFPEFGLNIGTLSSYIVGTFIPWNWLAIFSASVSCVHLILLLLIPESPRWLVMNGQNEAAASSLTWYSGSDANVHTEILQIKESLNNNSDPVPWLDYFKAPLRKSLFVVWLAFALQQLSGINIIRLNTECIFLESGSRLDPKMQTIVIGIVMTAGSVIQTVIVERFERRSLLLFSGVSIGVSMAVAGTYFKVKELDAHFAESHLYYLPLVSMITSVLMFSIGCGPVPLIILGELFSTRARGRAGGLATASSCLFGFLSTKLFHNFSTGLGNSGAFFLCTGFCFVTAAAVFRLIPKTRSKTLEEIQKYIEHE